MSEPQPPQDSSIISIDEILHVHGRLDPESQALVRKAYRFAEEAHKEQKRFSGEPYFTHLAGTAYILAKQGMDAHVISAGLLHDSIEDVGVLEETIAKEFGEDVAFIVQGTTKLGKLKYRGSDRHVENLRKLFIAMAKDIRVVIVKLADRLHNIQTLEHVKSEKQKRIAMETLEIYAPLANRLGMGKLKEKLEEGAFPYAYPDEYLHVTDLLETRKLDDPTYLEKFHAEVESTLKSHNISVVRVDYRKKGLYSLYQKLKRKEMDIDKIRDIFALRVIVPNVGDCYQVLGIIHGTWPPVPGKVKDYIAIPKSNGYQSIHTSVFSGGGRIVEIQIRTEAMHKEAEYGIATHIAYSESGKPKTGGLVSKKLAWIKQLLDWHKQLEGSTDFLERLKIDFFQERVFTFTPNGDVIELPAEATPIDFAYAVHSDIGDHASGAKVNGKLVPLDTKLGNGNIVEIETKKNAKPSARWLEFCKTSEARKHIRASLGTSK